MLNTRRPDDSRLIADALAALRKVASDAGDTVAELREKTGHSEHWIRLKLAKGIEEGLVVAGKADRVSRLTGITRATTVYRLVRRGK